MNSSSAIICWKNKILFFHRDNKPTIPFPDNWQLPGGGIEEGETPIEGLKRELGEEVSYAPKNIQFLGKVQRKDGITYIYGSFVSEKETRQFKIGKTEGQEIGFFSISEALKLKLTPELRNYVIKFRNEIREAFKKRSFPKITF